MNARHGCAAIALLVLAGSCHAAPSLLPGLFSTGLDADGLPLDGGAVDPHYSAQLIFAGHVLHDPAAHWLPNTDTSQWIWQTADGTPSSVMRIFRTTFELVDVDPTALTITGSWAVSWVGLDIRINGISTQQTAFGASSWTDFIISDGFVQGTNIIDFHVENYSGLAGFRVDGMVGTINLPASGSAGVMVIAGLAGARRRR